MRPALSHGGLTIATFVWRSLVATAFHRGQPIMLKVKLGLGLSCMPKLLILSSGVNRACKRHGGTERLDFLPWDFLRAGPHKTLKMSSPALKFRSQHCMVSKGFMTHRKATER